VAALVLGAHAMSLRNDARDAGCQDDLTHCPASALPTAETAYSSAKRATILFAVGTLAIGAGIYVRLTAPRAHAVSLSPALGPDTAGAALSGTF
jgi:hypothetical protein